MEKESMKKTMILFLSICLVLAVAGASAMTLSPEAMPSSINTKGTVQYYMSMVDSSQIESSGFFTIGLYSPEVFLTSGVKKLKAGDVIALNGKNVTVKSIRQTEEGWLELIPASDEYGYIFLVPSDSQPYYIAVVDDWIPCAQITELKVWMPLPDKFVYVSGPDEEQHSAGDFIKELQYGAGEWINQYNTTVTLENGVPVMITHTDYPEGPAK